MKNKFEAIAGVLFTVIFCFSSISAQDAAPKTINGGVLNGKAVSLPKPEYSAEAKAAKIEGTVRVDILIDEQGTVITAEPVIAQTETATVELGGGKVKTVENEPISPILLESAQRAAMAAKFSPTLLSGLPVKVRGVLIYNFMSSIGPSIINGGSVLNGKAINLPKPAYPPAARAVKAEGTVAVQVTIGENGEVESARAVSGHPLLRAAAVEAARGAKFNPTLLSGNPVKITGIIIYNFTAPDEVNK
jgi:TonB family protein